MNIPKENGLATLFRKVSVRSEDLPRYRQIKNRIVTAISNGFVKSGEIFPSEVELSRIMGVTRATVRQATNELVAEGILLREKGKRPRVAEPKEIVHFLNLGGISHYIKRDNDHYFCDVVQSSYQCTSYEVAEKLKIRKNSRVFVLERLRSSQDVIFGWEKTWMNKKLFPKIDKYDFSKESLYRVLKDKYNVIPSYSEGVIDVIIADTPLAKKFRIREGAPLLSVHRTVYLKDGQPMQLNHEIYRGDCQSFAFAVDNRK